jgi:hypothetical protein
VHFTLSDLVTDITQNGAESGADLVELEIRETEHGANGGPEFRFTVKDNGKGMSPEGMKRAQDPFVTDGIKHPHRKVGLGVPFLIQTAEQSGGGWKMESVKAADAGASSGVSSNGANHGTEVSAWFDVSNVDTPPIGDLSGMFRMVLLFQGPAEIVIRRVCEMGERQIHYEVRKTELAEALGGDLEDTQSQILLDRYLRSLEVNDDENEGEENG